MKTVDKIVCLSIKQGITRPARWINTLAALALIIIGVYHFTRPNAAWRSGTTEIVTAVCLLIAAYLVPWLVAVIINSFFVVVIIGLGVRHFMGGGSGVSGTIELLFAALLVFVSVSIYRKRIRT